jgi:L-lactate dehydrogenase complex protein LldG
MANSDRQRILDRIRRVAIEPVDLPSLDQSWIQYDDPIEQFQTTLRSVGGVAHVVNGNSEARLKLAAIPGFPTAKVVYSHVPELVESTIQVDHDTDPHSLAHVEFGVFRGEFGVAENGAIWLTAQQVAQRVLYFIAQHIVLVLATDQIVSNMHQAYQRLTFADRSFGVFMSGPSKTADIEQSLVMGAHGARSLTVLLTRSE